MVTGEQGWEARRYGDHGDKAVRYARTEEFLRIVRPLPAGASVDHTGECFATQDACVTAPGRDPPAEPPVIWFGGSSEYARPVAAQYADVRLSWLEPLNMIVEKIKWPAEAVREDRPAPRFGLRTWPLSRDTAEQAFADAEQRLAGIDPAHAVQARALLGARGSVCRAGRRSLLEGAGVEDLDSLHVAPRLWGGLGLLVGGSASAFVGSHSEVADRLEEYREIGVGDFILSGFPNLEEAHWLSDGLAPELRRAGTAGIEVSSPKRGTGDDPSGFGGHRTTGPGAGQHCDAQPLPVRDEPYAIAVVFTVVSAGAVVDRRTVKAPWPGGRRSWCSASAP